MIFKVYQDEAGEWRFRLVAANGEIVAQGESYTRPEDAERAVERIQAEAPKAAVEVDR